MSNTRPVPTDTDTARRLFFEKGRSPGGRVPEIIARSWERCSALLDNAGKPPPHRIDSHTLKDRRELRGHLRKIIEPEMDALTELVTANDCLVLLADADGMILDTAGAMDFLDKAEQVFLQPGVQWSEHSRGTNAIGTALMERQPVSVSGRQHYLEANGVISCVAAPILSSQGELLGVLDVSGSARQIHSHDLGMVSLAIQMLEHRLILDADKSATLLRFHLRPDLLGSHREGVLVLDDTRIIGANRAALQLLDTHWQELLDTSAEQWLQLPGSGGATDILSHRSGQKFRGSIVLPRLSRAPVSSPPAHGRRSEIYMDDETSALLYQASRVLNAGVSVLITGETGVGKEVFARQLHALSRRRQNSFVAVNCAALPESLIESELFGYECGAFTGARRKGMPGRVREADGGVLFLDEIGDMPLELQARLLRVLQEREVQPLGGGKPVAVDFDLICSTNRDLDEMVETGRFRADLYYRIQDFTLRLTPLRERRDRRRLINTLMDRLGGGERGLSLSEQALERLDSYAWPGNLRQLTSTFRTLIALADTGETISAEHLPENIRNHTADDASAPAGANGLQTLTRNAIEQALLECNGSISAAARQLGIHRSTIYRWLDKR